MIQSSYVFLVSLSIQLRAMEDQQSTGVQVGEINDRDPHAQMT